MPSQNQKRPPVYSFGWWPELVGALYALGLILFLFAYADAFI